MRATPQHATHRPPPRPPPPLCRPASAAAAFKPLPTKASLDDDGDGKAADDAASGGGEEVAARTPLVILGGAGSGKSTALAHWLMQNRRPGFVLPHFIGSSHNSTDHIEITRRILAELQRCADDERMSSW